MKTVKLRNTEAVKSIDLFKAALEQSSAGAIDIGEMRKRIRVLDVIEKDGTSKKELKLEDADFHVLNAAFQALRFVAVKREVVLIADDLANAAAS